MTTLISCTPPAHIEWTQDVFGNIIATASFETDTDKLTIDSRMVVDQSATAWPVFKIAPSAQDFPFTYSREEAADLAALREPQYPDAADSVRDWVEAFRCEEPTDTLTLLKTLNAGIASRLTRLAGDEECRQGPDDTIHSGGGSGRDFATLFIEAVRHLGFGARAVAGYLQGTTAGSDEVRKDHSSTHAWAEVYLPCAGWIAFDPTHAQMGGAGLIPVAVARNIEQISPIQGSYSGAPDDFLEMNVVVTVSIGTVLASAMDRRD